MIPGLANHLLQSTVFAVVAGLLTLCLRSNRAGTRYWIWLTASTKFLVPFSLFVGIGHRLNWSAAATVAAPQLAIAMREISQPFTPPFMTPGSYASTPIVRENSASILPTLLLAVWIIGCAAVLAFWLVRWRRVAALLRSGIPVHEGREIRALRRMGGEIEVVSSSSQIEPGIFGILRPVLSLPAGLADHLDDAELDAVFAHELSHVRRYDNLTAAIHMVVEACFWFHPLVWWIGTNLVVERERACDEEVVRLGSDPEVYAESILKICRLYLASPLACASGISGADLRKRIESIMGKPLLRSLGLGKKMLLGTLGILALVAPVVIGILGAPAGRAQRQSDATLPRFQLADIHSSARAMNPTMSGGILRADRYEIRRATMLDLIRTAWKVDGDNVLGGPPWLDSDRFEIVAKAPPGTDEETVRQMLQALLADRFGLVVRNETKPVKAYALTVGKRGPQMKVSDGTGPPGFQMQQQPGDAGVVRYTSLTSRHVTMTGFARVLRQLIPAYFSNPVVDQTGLQGAWDFDLKFTPLGLLNSAGDDGISVYDAVDKQLGLKLELKAVAMPVIVVDRVNEKPTDNLPGVTKTLPPAPTEFEVADIKPSAPDENRGQVKFQPGGRIEGRGVSLRDVIIFAWNIRSDDMLAGGPNWLDSTLFDVIAKAPGTGSEPANMDLDALQPMTRSLLSDRFKLKVHNETRPVQVYALTAAKPKIRKADPVNRSECRKTNVVAASGTAPGKSYDCTNMTMAQFVQKLAVIAPSYMDHPGVDLTGLEGAFDFTLSFSFRVPATTAQQSGTASDPSGAITLPEAIDKQLGLKLVLQKHPMPVLVIDHVAQKPTGN